MVFAHTERHSFRLTSGLAGVGRGHWVLCSEGRVGSLVAPLCLFLLSFLVELWIFWRNICQFAQFECFDTLELVSRRRKRCLKVLRDSEISEVWYPSVAVLVYITWELKTLACCCRWGIPCSAIWEIELVQCQADALAAICWPKLLYTDHLWFSVRTNQTSWENGLKIPPFSLRPCCMRT